MRPRQRKSLMSPDERAEQMRRVAETGAYLYELRLTKGVSLRDVATQVDVSANYLSEIERGVKIPSDHMLRDLAEYYEIDENSLFERMGRVPLAARELLEEQDTAARMLAEIQRMDVPSERKEELYAEIRAVYQRWLNGRK